MERGDKSRLFVLDTLDLIREHQIAFVPHFIYYLSPGSVMRSNDWASKKWDNLQVWIVLLEELRDRGMLQEYHQEIEYLFFVHGIEWGLYFIFRRGGILVKGEWKIVADIVHGMIPDIQENPYIKRENNPHNKVRNDLLFDVLNTEFTDDNVEMANQAMRKCYLPEVL